MEQCDLAGPSSTPELLKPSKTHPAKFKETKLKTTIFEIPTNKGGSTVNLVSPYFPSLVVSVSLGGKWKSKFTFGAVTFGTNTDGLIADFQDGSIFERCTSVSFQPQSVKYLLIVWTHEVFARTPKWSPSKLDFSCL